MEYRSVAYSIRARPGLDEWTWTIFRRDVMRTGEFSGSRSALVAVVENKIDNWLKNQRTAPKGSVFEQSEHHRPAELSEDRARGTPQGRRLKDCDKRAGRGT